MKISEAQRKATEALADPTPEQMFRLGAIGVCLGKGDGSFVESTKKASAHIFLGKENESIEAEDDNGMRYSTHKFTGRVERTDYRRWSMRIVEAYWVRGIDEDDDEAGQNFDGYRTSFCFEWTDKNVLMATKKMNLKTDISMEGGVLPEVMEDLLFEPDSLNAINELEKVSGGDCERFMADIRASRAALRSPLKYNR